LLPEGRRGPIGRNTLYAIGIHLHKYTITDNAHAIHEGNNVADVLNGVLLLEKNRAVSLNG
jgi:hypothetical protein